MENKLHSTPISSLYGVGRAKQSAYARLGVFSVYDLLYFFPRTYENRSTPVLLHEARADIKSAVVMAVATEPKISLIRKGMSLLKFRAVDDVGQICDVTYFNQNYLKEKFSVGSSFRFWGKVEAQKSRYSMTSPVAEPCFEGRMPPPFSPVYRLTEGLSQKQIAQHVEAALSLVGDMPDLLPDYIRQRYSLCTLSFALRQIHSPDGYESLAIAKKRLIFDEFFTFAAGMALSSRKVSRGEAIPCPDGDISALLSRLPFALTDAQVSAVEDVRRDMAKSVPMARIIIGDVGCGKTVCAAAAMYIAVKNGRQAALMAPTEILANQHYGDLCPLFESLGIKCALLTGSVSSAKKKKIYAALASNNSEERIDIVIGTHALVSEGVEFYALGLTVTDEQHRFGVNQRATLSAKGKYSHSLVMSATPIPRSLALVTYGDLDLSKIDVMPAGRQRVDTHLVDEGYRARLDAFIKKNVDAGGQVYIVCPAVEEKEIPDDEISLSDIFMESNSLASSKPPLKAATVYAEELSSRLPEYKIAFVHGRMKPSEKDAVMRDFADGKIQILVSTTVIEVGVNVPNASLMIVENAERFGLSQLHQLRGRVGRGSRKSYCVLVSGTKSLATLGENAKRRLDTMCRSYNGFEIAEEDLKLRGPGDFLASNSTGPIRQSGEICFRLADACEDSELMNSAFAEARAFVERDPSLSENPMLAEEIKRMFTIEANVIS